MKKRNWYLTFGLVLSAVMLCYMVLGFFWTPHDPGMLSASDKLASPSLSHPFGCDQLGRDVLSRALDGAGTTLIIALAVVLMGFVLGILIGSLCGYYGGMVDAVEYVSKLNFVDPKKIGVTGHSMGGGYADKTANYYTGLEQEALANGAAPEEAAPAADPNAVRELYVEWKG
mgnify:CR=1 FL=1